MHQQLPELQQYNKMSTEQMIVNNPPRLPTVPVTPLPQTVSGVLESSGLPNSDGPSISDIPPDFGWMSEMQTYFGTFNYDINSDMRSPLINFSVNGAKLGTKTDLGKELPSDNTQVWQSVPFLCSKWWSGSISFRFIALKPPRTPGKLIFRYSFLPKIGSSDPSTTFMNDSNYRGIAKEWDLSQSNIFEFDVTGMNPLNVRPTWLPDVTYRLDPGGVGSQYHAVQVTNPALYLMGRIQVEPAIPYQPGSLYPDSIRILVFRSFKNSQFYTPTDPRHYAKNSYFTSAVTAPMQMPHIDNQPPKPE